MLIVTISSLLGLGLGLLCLWTALNSLARLDQDRAQLELDAAQPQPEDTPEEKPRLTRLGRPVENIDLNERFRLRA